MSKTPTSRVLSRVAEAQRGKKLDGEKIEHITSGDTNSRKSLTNGEKQEIGDFIIHTSKKVAELIILLDGLIPTSPQVNTYNSYYGTYYSGNDYGRSPRYSENEVSKIRPLKNEVTAGYFSIGEKLRIHNIASDELIQKYYTRVKEFDSYHATTLNSDDVRKFHASIRDLVLGVLNKAFK